MKLLVFAHTPPPHHGQSYMVRLMLEGFGGDTRRPTPEATRPGNFGIRCFHVDARFCRRVDEIGGFQVRKMALLVLYCFQAVWCRFRYGVRNFYYVPAPGHRAALYRDWLVMLLCRPFFKRIIFHWHASGLTEWLQTSTSKPTRWLSRQLLGRPDLSIVLSHYNLIDPERLASRQNRIVHNGIPDPCPDFKRDIQPRRAARAAARQKLMAGRQLSPDETRNAGGDPQIVKVLFLSQCSRAKGLFDTLDGVALANRKLVEAGSLVRIHLTVAGEFSNPSERNEFDSRIAQSDLRLNETAATSSPGAESTRNSLLQDPAVRYVGFMAGVEKQRAFSQSDCFCLPVNNPNLIVDPEPLALIEAMAFGLPIVTTRWRSLSELVSREHLGPVDMGAPNQIADALIRSACENSGEPLRDAFTHHFSLERHWANLAEALCSLERSGPREKEATTGPRPSKEPSNQMIPTSTR